MEEERWTGFGLCLPLDWEAEAVVVDRASLRSDRERVEEAILEPELDRASLSLSWSEKGE